MKGILLYILLFAALCCPAFALPATVSEAPSDSLSVGPLFASGMVLQRDKPVRIWGTARAADRVAVSFGGHEVRTVADGDGRWSVKLPAMKASSEGRRMTVAAASGTIVLDDVLVGEVWLAGGQSNMAMSIRALNPEDRAGLGMLSDPLIRYYQVMPVVGGGKLLDKPDVVWSEPDPVKIDAWSAVAVYFARELRAALGVPVGIICVAQGSSTAEAWISREYTAAHSGLDQSFAPEFPADRIEHNYKNPHVLYESMFAKTVGFPLRGFIWYQGESNADRAVLYPAVFGAVIDCWREAWGDRQLPFVFVQLPAFDKKDRGGEPSWALMREAQGDVAHTVPHAAMVVSVDVGDPGNLHPKDKKTVGQRLSLAARRTVYGDRTASVSPVYESVRFKEGRALVRLRTGGSPLVRKGELREFEICGKDGVWHPALAELKGDAVVVWSDAVPQPVAVRYAWKNAATVSLYNEAGLPASPFRTDRVIHKSEK